MGWTHALKIMDFEKALGLWFRGNGANRKRLCRMKRITPRCSGVKRPEPRFFCPPAKTLGMRGLFCVKARICYADSKPGPMHRPPSNLVRSEEAAIRRRVECRGKPGPPFALSAAGAGRRLQCSLRQQKESPQPAKPQSGLAGSGDRLWEPSAWSAVGRACQPIGLPWAVPNSGRNFPRTMTPASHPTVGHRDVPETPGRRECRTHDAGIF